MSSGKGSCCNAECARALEGATVQIELALSESHAPVEQIGETIRRLAAMLRDVSTDESGLAAGTAEQRTRLEELRRGLSASIEKLQFHDRMVQHLSHVRDYLAAIANQIDREGRFDVERIGEGEQAWDELHLRLRERLISEAQRELFDLVLASEHAPETSDAKRNDYATQGSIELF